MEQFLQTPSNENAKNNTEQNENAKSENVDNTSNDSPFELRYIYSYFAAFGDSLLDSSVDSYPEGLLLQLKNSGVNGVWLHTVLRDIAPPNETFSDSDGKYETRLQSLRTLVNRAKKYGIKVYLYVNEPRAMHESFFNTDARKKFAGVREGNYFSLCTSCPEVRKWLGDSLQYVFEHVPELGGVFTITASENLTHCASHHQHKNCPNCKDKSFADILADVNTIIEQGVHRGNPDAKVIVWDWGWQDNFAEEIINRLPKSCWFMSVSEWSLPIERGGIASAVGEYSISSVGPGPRASRHWEFARRAGLKTVAKVQVNATWEMSAVPYIPALELVARHGDNLSRAQVNGLMLSWSVGGYPSANLDLFRRFMSQKQTANDNSSNNKDKKDKDESTNGNDKSLNDNDNENRQNVIDSVMRQTAAAFFGEENADAVVNDAWKKASASFREYPYHGRTLYQGPQHVGPANLFYRKPTGYHSTMVGFPYDDLNSWRSIYPPEIYVEQMTKSAAGFADAAACFRKLAACSSSPELAKKFEAEARIADTIRIHFLSAANQAKFIINRNANDEQKMSAIVQQELQFIKEFFPIVKSDSRIGYESSNHYYYIPIDIAEKVVNCKYLLEKFAITH